MRGRRARIAKRRRNIQQGAMQSSDKNSEKEEEKVHVW